MTEIVGEKFEDELKSAYGEQAEERGYTFSTYTIMKSVSLTCHNSHGWLTVTPHNTTSHERIEIISRY